MSELKTKPTGASVAHFISAIPDPVRRGDCRTLASLMRRATGAKAEMWGPSIVGFGHFHYRYGSGREGDWFLAGFSPRKQELTVYVMGGLRDNAALLAKLGKHKASSGCLYLKRLAEVDLTVLETLVARSAATLRAMHSPPAAAKPAVKPAARPASKPATHAPVASAKPMPKPALKPAARPAARPAAKPATHAPVASTATKAIKPIKAVKPIKPVKPAKPKRAAVTATRRGR